MLHASTVNTSQYHIYLFILEQILIYNANALDTAPNWAVSGHIWIDMA